MEETTTVLDEGFDISNVSLDDVFNALQQVAKIYRTIIDTLKSFIKPALKSVFDSILNKNQGE